MSKYVIKSVLFYVLIIVSTSVIGFLLWGYFSSVAYQIVTLFLTLVIVSNCLAKLFLIFINR